MHQKALHLPFGLTIIFRVGDCQKIAYGAPHLAAKGAYRMEENTGERFDVYRCRWCLMWHIGHAR